MVPSERKTQFLNPSQWDPWEFFNKKNCPDSFLLQKEIPPGEAEMVVSLKGTAIQVYSEVQTVFQILVVLLQSCNLKWSARD